jgi:tetratricopeptide (TPR) repeat protein
MSDTLHCTDCGQANPPGSTACMRCNYPLIEAEPHDRTPAVEVGEQQALATPPGGTELGEPSAPVAPLLRPIRTRRPNPQGGLPVTLWLGIGAFVALLLVLVAVQANLERHDPPVAGSTRDQQKVADAFRAALEQDSTDVRSRVGLADILFDTGNWPEAVIHYSSAVRHDSTQITAIVDLGVCYYNLGVPAEAERLFHLALSREAHQPYALFNLGIVHERRGDLATALKYFHGALQASPPENMKPAVMEAMQRVQQASGKEAPPLDTPK